MVLSCQPAMDGNPPQLPLHGGAAWAAGQAPARLGARTPRQPGVRSQGLLQEQPSFPLQGVVRENFPLHSGSPQQGEYMVVIMMMV